MLISCGLVVVYYNWAYFGHFGYDDMQYALAAKELLNGNFDAGDHFAYRIPVVWATAAAYYIFGISDFASALPAILITWVILWGVYRVLRPSGNYVLAAGLSLSLLSGWILFNSHMLMPDQHVAAGIIMALVSVHLYKFQRGENSPHRFAIGFACALIYAFAAKGTVVLLLPLLAYLFLVDLARRRDQRFWWLSTGYTFAGLFLYFGFTWWLTGDPFMRFRAIQGNQYIHDCSYAELPLVYTLRRIGYELLEMLFREGMLTGLVISLVLVFSKKSWWKFNDGATFWFVCGLGMLLSANFMSISPFSYSPMCVDPRHYLFLVPIGGVAGAYGIETFWKGTRSRRELPVILGAAAATGFLQAYKLLDNEYTLLLVAAGVYLLIRQRPWAKTVFLVLLVAALCLRLFNNVTYYREVRYPAQRDFVFEHLLDSGEPALVLTDPVMKRWGDYFNGFNSEDEERSAAAKVAMPVRFLSYQDSIPLDLLTEFEDGQYYLLKNWHSQYLSEITWEALPYFAREPEDEGAVMVAEQPATSTALYNLPAHLLDATVRKDTLLYSKNAFERPEPYWAVNDALLQQEEVANGEWALKAGEFTGTLEFPLDSLMDRLPAKGSLVIRAIASCNFSGPTTAVLCVSVEDNSGLYHYFTKAIDDQLEAYTFFWPSSMEERIPVEQIRPNSTLKVYVWNKDQQEGFVDDFSVLVSGISTGPPARNE
ncbi:hypothetical protein CEQ90_03815 [Lewinellaceae bacterium SD302]|nr:hypothetical protein CEQ90_03815 [Lewinellaceae bacterium SD302]